MTAIQAYILAKKIALGAVSGIQNLTFQGNQIIFHFNDGSQATMVVPLPQDGISITKVEIDTNNHLICTMSDGSTQDAGEIPGGKGGGLVQVNNKIDLPAQGTDNTLYLTKNDGTLYYWDGTKYKSISSSGGGEIDIKTSLDITFDGIETTFNLPIDDKQVMVYLNGIYLTEDEDYSIDRTVTPNTITFIEAWEESDICTIVWITGGVSGGGAADASLAKESDIDKLFPTIPGSIPDEPDIYAKEEDIDNMFK